jgi:hypothetical protein
MHENMINSAHGRNRGPGEKINEPHCKNDSYCVGPAGFRRRCEDGRRTAGTCRRTESTVLPGLSSVPAVRLAAGKQVKGLYLGTIRRSTIGLDFPHYSLRGTAQC